MNSSMSRYPANASFKGAARLPFTIDPGDYDITSCLIVRLEWLCKRSGQCDALGTAIDHKLRPDGSLIASTGTSFRQRQP